MNQKTKRILSGVGAVIVALALLIGGTYAYTAYDHRSNPFRNDPNYQGRLVEDYEEKDWEKDVKIKKEISVKNMGGTEQFPGKNWGDIFVRVKLKEHMDITPIDYVYYPENDQVNKVRFMTDKEGNFVRFTASGTNGTITTAQLTTVRSSPVWNNVIANAADRTAFTNSLVPANFIRLCGYYDSQDYWYVVTKAGDPNGQYGSFVVVDKTLDVTRMQSITGSDRATGIDYGSGLHIQDPSEHDNEECLYPTHYWDEDEPEICELKSHDYVSWELGPSIILIDDWDGQAADAWILNPVTGWATWGNALQPGESTDLLLKSVTPIRFPDGDMLYVIHADMQCTDRMDMLREDFWKDDDGNDDPWDIENIVGEKNTAVDSVEINGGDRTMVVGDEDQLKAQVRPGNATNKRVRWRSSDPSVVTVDDDGNITAVGEGEATITVTTEDGDLEDTITITVAPAAVPPTGVSFDGLAAPASIELSIGETYTPTLVVTPPGATYTAAWSRVNGTGQVTVDASTGLITGVAAGTATVTVNLGNGVTASIAVTVKPDVYPGTGVTINLGDTVSIEVGEELTLAITKQPPNTTDIPQWSSDNTGIVTVDANGKIKGIAPGTANVKVKLRDGVEDTIAVTVTQAASGISIDAGDAISVNVGQTLPALAVTKTPANATGTPVWSTTDGTGKVTVTQSGAITGVQEGTATVTVTLGSASDTITVTINPATGPRIPTKGDGTYSMVGNENVNLSYSIIGIIDAYSFDVLVHDQDGTIKLKDILDPSFTDYGSLSVTSSDPAVASKVRIGKDKGNFIPGTNPAQFTAPDDAIVISYYGTKAQWDAAQAIGVDYPPVQVELILSAPGYTNATIRVDLAFDGSVYWV